MLKNYFILVMQCLLSDKVFSLFNIPGSLNGVACRLMLVRCIQKEFSHEKIFKNDMKVFNK